MEEFEMKRDFERNMKFSPLTWVFLLFHLPFTFYFLLKRNLSSHCGRRKSIKNDSIAIRFDKASMWRTEIAFFSSFFLHLMVSRKSEIHFTFPRIECAKIRFLRTARSSSQKLSEFYGCPLINQSRCVNLNVL